MHLKFLGHSCFQIEENGTVLLTDPFLTGNPMASQTAAETYADYILVSHAHSDHLGDAAAIAQREHATVLTTVELANQIFAPGQIACVAGNLGGTLPLPFGSVKLVQALHSCGLPGGISCGFLVRMGGKCIYFAGDTALTMDMTLLREERVDAALLPIGGFYTMGPDDALRAVEMIRPKLVIPMHYNTMPPIRQDASAFVRRVAEQGIAKAVPLAPGESAELS